MIPEKLTKNKVVLFDFFQKETYPRGGFMALLWQMDVATAHTGFLQYRISQKQK